MVAVQKICTYCCWKTYKMNETLTRFLSGLVYVTLLIVATAYSVQSFYVLFGIFLIITLFEFCRILKVNFYLPIVIACISYFLAAKYYTFRSFDLFILGFTLVTSFSLVQLLFNTGKNELSSLKIYLCFRIHHFSFYHHFKNTIFWNRLSPENHNQYFYFNLDK